MLLGGKKEHGFPPFVETIRITILPMVVNKIVFDSSKTDIYISIYKKKMTAEKIKPYDCILKTMLQ